MVSDERKGEERREVQKELHRRQLLQAAGNGLAAGTSKGDDACTKMER
jgi:hypothetical protein